MASPQLLDQVRELREASYTPAEIARKLNMRPSAVAPLIRQVAAAAGRTREDKLIGCWVSGGWSASIGTPQRPDWPGSAPSPKVGSSGLVQVLVARERGGSTAGVCFYLVDTWCLGVKDAAGPRTKERQRLGEFTAGLFSKYEEPAVQVPLELAQQIVYGGIGYARGLGFEPHEDFARAAGYLGDWDGTCELTFGYDDGRPFYIAGPNDNSMKIMNRLRRTAGDGSFR
jgi:hypothetical protein